MTVRRRVETRGRGRPERLEHGQATVEFALVLPLVTLLIIGIVQVARVTSLQIATIDAARAGARAASVDPRSSVAEQGATRHANAEVQMTLTGGSPREVTVRVTRPVNLVPGLGWSQVTLDASTTMAVEPSA